MVDGYIRWYFNSRRSSFDFTDCLPSRDWKARVALSGSITLFHTVAARLINNLFFIFILLFFLSFLQRTSATIRSLWRFYPNNEASKRIIIEINNRCLIDRFPLWKRSIVLSQPGYFSYSKLLFSSVFNSFPLKKKKKQDFKWILLKEELRPRNK